MSSWAVWASLGMYPQAAGTGQLALAEPAFPSVVVHRPGGPRTVLVAPDASATSRDIRTLAVTAPQRKGS